MLHEKLSSQIIKAYYAVYNELGYGFLEKVYENAMVIVLKSYGIAGYKQVPIKVFFREDNVGLYFADLIIEDKIIIELKAADNLCLEHDIQLVNYLRATVFQTSKHFFDSPGI